MEIYLRCVSCCINSCIFFSERDDDPDDVIVMSPELSIEHGLGDLKCRTFITNWGHRVGVYQGTEGLTKRKHWVALWEM